MVQTLRRTTELPQLLDTMVDVPVAQVVQVVAFVVVQRRFPMVQTVLRTMVFLLLQSVDKVFDVSVVQVQQIPRVQSGRGQPRSHRCSRWSTDDVVACPLCATTVDGWFGVQNTALVPQLQCSDSLSGDFGGPCGES